MTGQVPTLALAAALLLFFSAYTSGTTSCALQKQQSGSPHHQQKPAADLLSELAALREAAERSRGAAQRAQQEADARSAVVARLKRRGEETGLEAPARLADERDSAKVLEEARALLRVEVACLQNGVDAPTDMSAIPRARGRISRSRGVEGPAWHD